MTNLHVVAMSAEAEQVGRSHSGSSAIPPAERIAIYPVTGGCWIDWALNLPLRVYAVCLLLDGLLAASLVDC